MVIHFSEYGANRQSLSKIAIIRTLLIIFLLMPCISMAQTTIVIFKTMDERILIGADSKAVRTYHILSKTTGKSRQVDSTYSTCKIHTVGNKHIAVSGKFLASQLVPLAKNSCTISSTVYAAAKSFEKQLKDFLRTEFSKKEMLKVYNRIFQPNDFIVSFAFAAVENGRAAFYVVSAKYQLDVHGKVNPSYGFDRDMDFFIIGHQSAIYRQIPNVLDIYTSGAMNGREKEWIYKLINIEIHNNSGAVGPPVNILEISRYGIQWLQPLLKPCPN
jgi:hypothetical protein